MTLVEGKGRRRSDFFVRQSATLELESIDTIVVAQRLPTGRNAFIAIGLDEGQLPLGVMISVGKGGTDISANAEAIAGLANHILANASPDGAREAVETVIEILGGPGTSDSVGFGSRRVTSLSQAVALALRDCLPSEVPEDARIHELDTNIGRTSIVTTHDEGGAIMGIRSIQVESDSPVVPKVADSVADFVNTLLNIGRQDETAIDLQGIIDLLQEIGSATDHPIAFALYQAASEVLKTNLSIEQSD